ncbi:MAG: CHAD domain-containing protein [Pseudomonadota bacterium]|nr:CHAD domain-containing protein [Pseudomonadota bacterium]
MQCLSLRGARLHKGVHQGRKSLRRTRAVLALAKPALGAGARLIDRELRRINRSLSTLRDTQALVETLDRLAKKNPSDGSRALLQLARRDAVKARTAQARATLKEDADFAGRRAQLAVLAAGLQALPWAAIDQDVQASLRKSATKATGASERAQKSGDDQDWHRWRRRARRLSQQYRALGGAAIPLSANRDRDKTLAELLGKAQDFALLIDHCGGNSPFDDAIRKDLRKFASKHAKQVRARIAKTANHARSVGD